MSENSNDSAGQLLGANEHEDIVRRFQHLERKGNAMLAKLDAIVDGVAYVAGFKARDNANAEECPVPDLSAFESRPDGEGPMHASRYVVEAALHHAVANLIEFGMDPPDPAWLDKRLAQFIVELYHGECERCGAAQLGEPEAGLSTAARRAVELREATQAAIGISESERSPRAEQDVALLGSKRGKWSSN
jgi:hypothetical protein